MLKSLRRQLLKIGAIERRVADYKLRQKRARHRQRWGEIMSAGRNVRADKSDRADTLGIVTLEEHRGGRVVAREEVILESRNWGGMKL